MPDIGPRPTFQPVDPAGLPTRLATELVEYPVPGTALRVAIDGPRVADPGAFAEALVVPLCALGRPATHIRAEMFWRDAALRLEYGRTDLTSFVNGWLDVEALRREVLDPLGQGGSGRFLSSLRDPVSNRATREPVRSAEPGSIVLISGELLLGQGLPFDRTIHLGVNPVARRRRTPEQWRWTLPAFDDYDDGVDPVRHADVALRYDDPRHPAIRVDPALHDQRFQMWQLSRGRAGRVPCIPATTGPRAAGRCAIPVDRPRDQADARS